MNCSAWLLLYNSLICNCPHVNDGLGRWGLVGNVFLVKWKQLQWGCWLCIAVTRQVWTIASRIVWYTSVNPVWFNLLSSIKIGTGKRSLCFKGYKMHLYVRILLSANCVCVCMSHECVFGQMTEIQSINTHLDVALCLAAFPDIQIWILQYCPHHMHFKSTPSPSRLCAKVTDKLCVVHNSLATALAFVHTHLSS